MQSKKIFLRNYIQISCLNNSLKWILVPIKIKATKFFKKADFLLINILNISHIWKLLINTHVSLSPKNEQFVQIFSP